MPKYIAKFQRDFEVEIEADNGQIAEQLANGVLKQFPVGTVKILSIVREGVDLNAPCAECQEHGPIKPDPIPPYGRPNGGGSPGTPVVRVPELVDQAARVA